MSCKVGESQRTSYAPTPFHYKKRRHRAPTTNRKRDDDGLEEPLGELLPLEVLQRRKDGTACGPCEVRGSQSIVHECNGTYHMQRDAPQKVHPRVAVEQQLLRIVRYRPMSCRPMQVQVDVNSTACETRAFRGRAGGSTTADSFEPCRYCWLNQQVR